MQRTPPTIADLVAMSVPIAAPMLSLTLPPMLLATVQTVMVSMVPMRWIPVR